MDDTLVEFAREWCKERLYLDVLSHLDEEELGTCGKYKVRKICDTYADVVFEVNKTPIPIVNSGVRIILDQLVSLGFQEK
jgi:hypothetical protein